ncbi:MAG: hypothetical protein JWN04_2388 [Myxococcaceae bacterium]|nr:hypothetical protein [Myxococcaceae bacterium]
MMPERTNLCGEPATAHFTPAELAAFLEQLALLHPEEFAPDSRSTQAASSHPVRQRAPARSRVLTPPLEPPTVVDSGHLLAVGALRGRARSPQPDERLPSRERSHETLEHPPWLPRVEPWRRAFVFVATCSVALLVVLSLRMGTRPAKVTPMRRPPLLPAPSQAFVAPAALESPETEKVELAMRAPGPPAGTRSPLTLPHRATEAAPEQSAAPVAASLRPRPAARREAVDLLLSGRSRAALDAYRALLSSSPEAPQTDALEHVVRLLEREQASCARKPGASCGT